MTSPPLPPIPPPPRPSLEFRFGRWLTSIGAVFGVITLALIFSLSHAFIFRVLGPGGVLGVSALVCLGLVILAERLERRDPALFAFARSLLALGLAGLYLVLYAAHSFPAVRIVTHPVPAGLLLLAWSVYVLFLAQRKESQPLALFAIFLAYFSTVINQVGGFSMAADLLLAGTAVYFLFRQGWTALSYLGLLGTYFALLRRLVIDENGELSVETSRMLPFAPYAVYLIGAWGIFTAAVLLSRAASFRGAARLAFLSVNNGLFAGLLVLTAFIAGYGYHALGRTLLWTGVLFLAISALARVRRADAGFAGVASAYLAQGLAVFTGGLMVVYTGVTRGILLTLETLFLGFAAGFSRALVLQIAAYVAAFFATLFLVWEIAVNVHHPWLLGLGGAVVMLVNALGARRGVRRTSARGPIVLAASYYCALALGLICTAMDVELSDAALPPALAFVAVGLTFSIYLLPLAELPPLAQTLMLAAQALVLFPPETGLALPRSSTAWVAVLTLVLLAWWSRQRFQRYGPWVVGLNFIYALALVGLAWHAVRPYVDAQTWMISAGLISGGLLAFGAFTRVWSLAVMGQLFLGTALLHFFFPHGDPAQFPWAWWAAAAPIAVVFATGRSIHAWLRAFPEIMAPWRARLRLLGFGYELLALAMVVRWMCALVPAPAQIGAFLFAGTLLLAWNARRDAAFGVRCSFVLSSFGTMLVLHAFVADPRALATWLNGLALFSLLTQPTLLRHAAQELVSSIESWMLVLFSSAAGWLFVDAWVASRLAPRDVTLGWALYALFLFFFGLLVRTRRQRWCGLAILAAAMGRVLCYDVWGLPNGDKVLTFFVLTLIALGLGFLHARLGDRLKTWL